MVIEYPEIREAENFHGFHTVHFYESECRRAGQEIRRIPCRAADGTACVVLINSVQGTFDGIDIVTADERHCLYSGSVRHGEGFLETLLAKQGFSLAEQTEESPSVGASPQPTSDIPVTPKLYEETVGEFTQYSLFA